MTDLYSPIDEVVLERVDVRLARKVLEQAGEDGELEITYQELAMELSSAREVISRPVRDMQRRGWIRGRQLQAARPAVSTAVCHRVSTAKRIADQPACPPLGELVQYLFQYRGVVHR